MLTSPVERLEPPNLPAKDLLYKGVLVEPLKTPVLQAVSVEPVKEQVSQPKPVENKSVVVLK